VLLSASIAKVFRYEKITISPRTYELLLDIIP
jgi:hypothetical protein